MIDYQLVVNVIAYKMDYVEATDILCGGVSHADLAEELDVSVATVRQARLSPDAKAHRTAPVGWQAAVARLAEKRARQLARLAETLKGAR